MGVLVLMIAFRGSTAFAQKPFAFSGLKLPACQYIELVPQGSNFEFPAVRTESANFPPIVGREAEKSLLFTTDRASVYKRLSWPKNGQRK